MKQQKRKKIALAIGLMIGFVIGFSLMNYFMGSEIG